MPKLIVEEAAEADLDEIFEVDEDVWAVINTLLDEIYGNDALIKLLCADRTARLEDPAFDNEKFIELWNDGYTIFRLKMRDFDGGLIPYRVLHAYDGRSDSTHVLGILDREHSYDTSHQKVRRCVENYDALGIYRAK